jgi:hypothetical protein
MQPAVCECHVTCLLISWTLFYLQDNCEIFSREGKIFFIHIKSIGFIVFMLQFAGAGSSPQFEGWKSTPAGCGNSSPDQPLEMGLHPRMDRRPDYRPGDSPRGSRLVRPRDFTLITEEASNRIHHSSL